MGCKDVTHGMGHACKQDIRPALVQAVHAHLLNITSSIFSSFSFKRFTSGNVFSRHWLKYSRSVFCGPCWRKEFQPNVDIATTWLGCHIWAWWQVCPTAVLPSLRFTFSVWSGGQQGILSLLDRCSNKGLLYFWGWNMFHCCFKDCAGSRDVASCKVQISNCWA